MCRSHVTCHLHLNCPIVALSMLGVWGSFTVHIPLAAGADFSKGGGGAPDNY